MNDGTGGRCKPTPFLLGKHPSKTVIGFHRRSVVAVSPCVVFRPPVFLVALRGVCKSVEWWFECVALAGIRLRCEELMASPLDTVFSVFLSKKIPRFSNAESMSRGALYEMESYV